jgi:hypothetical protein
MRENGAGRGGRIGLCLRAVTMRGNGGGGPDHMRRVPWLANRLKENTMHRCIFCDRPRKPTNEHIWAKWVRKLIPRDPAAPKRTLHTTGLSVVDENGQVRSSLNLRGNLARSGEMLDRKLRVVCGDCNNGWMNDLQKRVRPFLEPRIQNDWSEPLAEIGQAAIAAWATMFTMVVEQADPPTIAISQEDRSTFKTTHEPLRGWLIFLGRNTGVPGKFYHQAFGIEGPGWLQEDRPRMHNTQITTFTVGGILLQTMSSQIDYFETTVFTKMAMPGSTEQYADSLGFCRIWPPRSSQVSMPAKVYSDQDFVLLASVLPLAGLFGKPSSLLQAIASGQFDPTFTGYHK